MLLPLCSQSLKHGGMVAKETAVVNFENWQAGEWIMSLAFDDCRAVVGCQPRLGDYTGKYVLLIELLSVNDVQ